MSEVTSTAATSSSAPDVKKALASRRKDVDPDRKYHIAFGVVGAAIAFGLVVPLLSPAPKPGSIFVNDAGLISHVNNNAHSWQAGEISSFEGWTVKQVKKWAAVGVSQGGLLNSQQCNVGEIPGIPSEFDARKRWPDCFAKQEDRVYHQGNCSASYAISTATTLSNRFCISDPELYSELQLAPQYMLSCDQHVNKGCMGGDLDKVYYFTEGHGLVDERCFPYAAKDARKLPCKTKMQCDDKKRYRTSSYCVMTDGAQVRSEMLLNGPVVALMYLYDDFLVYKSGVYTPMATATAILGKSQEPLLHAVKILGWGEEEGTPYWLIENSFGKEWGEKGVGKIIRAKAFGKQMNMGEYDPRLKRDIVLLEDFVLSAVPYTARMKEIHTDPDAPGGKKNKR
ncbi:unnamed protein product [Amoebophrya sp. A25]|nr:unnamed protein product [Amoebophrya sp. A25]|eukprot:GSA25T00026852001.1